MTVKKKVGLMSQERSGEPKGEQGGDGKQRGIRQTLRSLQASLGDPAALHHAYLSAKHGALSSRLLLGVVDRIYPAAEFLRLACELDQGIRKDGYAAACQEAAVRLVGPWQIMIPPETTGLAESGGAVFYGNHPSLMTPFLLGAAIPRPDLRFVSTGYVCKLIPEFGNRSFAVEMPLDRVTKELRRGGTRRVLAHLLMSLLHAVPDQDELKIRNRLALSQAADHVRHGGALVICPDGGGTRSGRWYPGIAQIAQTVRTAGASAHFVPFHEANCTNGRVYARLMRGLLPALRRRWHGRRPVSLSFGEPISHAALPANASIEELLDALRGHYEGLRQRRDGTP